MGFFGRSRSTTNRADRIGDFQINTASYGEVVPEILGTTRVSGNIIDYEDFTAHEHKSTTRTGKGGRSKHTEITYTYTVAAAIGLCEGPIRGIGRVWRDKEIYQYPNEKIELTLFNGENGQAPWPYMVSKHSEKALPYSGLAYMAGVVDLGDRGSLPQYNFEIMGKLLETGDGVDVNPADYIVHVLQSIGADVAIEGLDNFRAYCRAADILISTPPDQKSAKAQQVINDIAEITNSLVFWSTDRLKIVPLADKPIGDWSPQNQIQYDLTADDLIPGSDGQLILYKRKDTSESYNEATVEFVNRANGYEKETVSFEVVADVQKNGLKPASKKSALYLYTKARAQYYAEQLAMKRLYSKTQYTFRLDWAFCTLEVGDLVTLTDEACQLDKQIVVITSVNEAADGQLEFTAEGKPAGTYAPAKYNVHENERPFIDFNAPAPPINDVSVFQTVGDVGGNQIFVGVNAPNGWGGCSVWLSDTGENYSRIGTISQQARMGRTLNAIKSDGKELSVKLNQGSLKGGTHIDAERANTLSWIGGEALSYEGAQLQASGSYKLTNLVRGQYATQASNHAKGARFIRVDEALFRYPYRKEDIGKTIYLKFTSMNIFGTNEQGLDEVKAYSYKIVPYYIPEVSNLALYTKYYAIGNGVKSFDVVAQFDRPQINSFDTVELWYRESSGNWKYGGSGDGLISISGCELGHTYEVKLVVKDTHGNTSQGVMDSIRIELKSEIPNAPKGFSVSFGENAVFNWLEVRNADVDYYELRLDLNAGQEDGLIGRSNNTTYSGLLKDRKATVYIFAHNPIKGYGPPAQLTYNVPKPKAPTNVTATGTIDGIGLRFNAIPIGCKGANIYINDERYFTANSMLTIPYEAGVHSVFVAYVDMFGEGDRIHEILVTVKAKIDKELLDMESLGIVAIEEAVKNIEVDMDRVEKSMEDADKQMRQDIQNFYKVTNQLDKDAKAIVSDVKAVRKEMSDTNKNLSNKITTSVNGVKIDLENKTKGLSNQITTSVNGMKTTLDDTVNKLSASTTVTINGIRTEFNDKVKEISSTTTTTVNGIRTELENKTKGLSNQITTSVNGTRTSLEDKINKLSTKTETSVNGIKTELTNAVNGMTTKINTSVNGIRQEVAEKVKGLDGIDSKIQSSITQASKAIELKVEEKTTGEKLVSKINLSKAGTRIDGKLLHVTGKALFDDNIITNKMLQARSVSADKMQVSSLSALSANIGLLRTKSSGARVEIRDNLIQVFDDNNRLRIRIGVWG